MIKSTKFLAAAALTGLVLSIAGLAAAPFATSANAAAGQGEDFVSDRIGGAFASIVEIAPDQAITDAAARVAKGDFLGKPGCLGAIWPNIRPECLANGRRNAGARPSARSPSATRKALRPRPGAHARAGGCLPLTASGTRLERPGRPLNGPTEPRHPIPRPASRPHLAPLRPPLVRSADAGRGARLGRRNADHLQGLSGRRHSDHHRGGHRARRFRAFERGRSRALRRRARRHHLPQPALRPRGARRFPRDDARRAHRLLRAVPDLRRAGALRPACGWPASCAIPAMSTAAKRGVRRAAALSRRHAPARRRHRPQRRPGRRHGGARRTAWSR